MVYFSVVAAAEDVLFYLCGIVVDAAVVVAVLDVFCRCVFVVAGVVANCYDVCSTVHSG